MSINLSSSIIWYKIIPEVETIAFAKKYILEITGRSSGPVQVWRSAGTPAFPSLTDSVQIPPEYIREKNLLDLFIKRPVF